MSSNVGRDGAQYVRTRIRAATGLNACYQSVLEREITYHGCQPIRLFHLGCHGVKFANIPHLDFRRNP